MLQQQRRKKLAVIAIIAGAVIAGLAIASFAPMQTELTTLPPEDKDMAESIELARNFLVSGPTFSFDGIKESVDVINPIESLQPVGSDKMQHIIHIAFDSTHAGYGDRTDQVLAEVITHHTAEITVLDGKIVSAIIDETWDELHPSFIVPLEASSPLEIRTDRDQYLTGQTITITITNTGNTRLFPVGWGYSIVSADGQKYAPNGVLKMMLVALSPGKSIHWTWDQVNGDGAQVGAGKYQIIGSYVEEGTEKEISNSKEIEISELPHPKLASHDGSVTPFEGLATDYSSLVAAMESRGVLVEKVDETAAEGSSFGVPIKVISVGGANVQVYEFESESDANTASLTVSEDGTQIGNSVIRWTDAPHFYTNGKLIVLYVGQNPEVTNLLDAFLGTQFAGM